MCEEHDKAERIKERGRGGRQGGEEWVRVGGGGAGGRHGRWEGNTHGVRVHQSCIVLCFACTGHPLRSLTKIGFIGCDPRTSQDPPPRNEYTQWAVNPEGNTDSQHSQVAGYFRNQERWGGGD